MRARTHGGRSQAGFTMLEILVVVAIGLIVTLTALPMVTNTIANMKLRASMTTVSGLLQNTRMMAVQKNKTMTARNFSRTSPPYSLVYYVKDATVPTSVPMSGTDPQVELEAPISTYDTPTGSAAPPAITNSVLGLTSSPLTTDPSFNSRGIPCAYSSSCTTNNGFIKYFKDARINNSSGWAAISITPAGRIKRWFWNGSAWTD